MSEWQAIETAPKNPSGEFYGPVILVWDKATELPWPAQWAQGGPDNAGCWRILNDSAVKPEHNEIWPDDATHWMPLPPAPSRQKEDA